MHAAASGGARQLRAGLVCGIPDIGGWMTRWTSPGRLNGRPALPFCFVFTGLDRRACALRSWSAVEPTHQPEHWKPEQDQRCAKQRAFQVTHVAFNQHNGATHDKNCRQQGVAPHLVGSDCIGALATVNKPTAGREHVKEPLSEDGQLEELLKLVEEEQQKSGEQGLNDQRRRWRLKAWMNVRELAEEEAIARGGEWNARSGHHGSVERDKNAEGHARGHEASSGWSGNHRERGDGGPAAGGNLRRGQNVLDAGVGCHKEKANQEESTNESDGQAAARVAYFACHHGEVAPAIVCPERSNKCGHEAGEATGYIRQCGGEVGEGARTPGKAESNDDEDQDDFEDSKNQLEVTSFLDAEAVEPGDEPCHGHGKEL